MYRDRPTIYPNRRAVLPGRPLIIPEGEFDCLLLAQELVDLASVVTLGSASSRPDTTVFGYLLCSPRWYIATDNDAAGDKAAGGWPTVARRVRPPMLRPHPDDGEKSPKTDWTDLHQFGVDLRRWWSDRLGGNVDPPLFTWEEAASWRWGLSVGGPTPGIIIESPEVVRMRTALQTAVDAPDALAERLAIQYESEFELLADAQSNQ